MASERRDPEVVRMRVRAGDPLGAEIAAAEAFEAGATGVVEDEDGVGLTVYALPAEADAVVCALRAVVVPLELGALEPVEAVQWSEAWKRVLGPVEISSRLVVAPTHAEFEPLEDQCCIWIEPGQAFGTGAHHSTRLALQGIDTQCQVRPPARALDVGTGSGVLALAALALGAEMAVGFDLDPLAAPAARSAARANGLSDRLQLFTGPIEALAAGEFELVAANLLRSELLPIAGAVAQRVGAGGVLVLAGLLEADVPPALTAFEPYGLCERLRQSRRDEDGEHWIGLTLCR